MDYAEYVRKVQEMDALYKPFPDIKEWSGVVVDQGLWQEKLAIIEALKQGQDTELWERATDYALRVAAVDTGAIEGLYQTTRGITLSIATQAFAFETETKRVYEEIKEFFEAQLKGYKLTIDAITEKTPISEAWIRALHETLTGAQDEYEVITPAGKQMKKLVKGTYKTDPNHVVDSSGNPKFSYAPVGQVAIEMGRLMTNLRSETFAALHPTIQAAFAHYAFVKIHPFPDGNGRVARALASLYLIKASYIPFIVFLEDKDIYLDSLEEADLGHYKEFVDFVFNRGIGAIEIVRAFADAAKYAPAKDTLKKVKSLFVAHSGLGHSELDEIGRRVLNWAKQALDEEVKKLIHPPVQYEVLTPSTRAISSAIPSGYRPLVGTEAPALRLRTHTSDPANADVSNIIKVFVAKTEMPEELVVLVDKTGKHMIKASLRDVKVGGVYKETTQLYIRLHAWAVGLIGDQLENLYALAEQSFRKSPYGGT